MSLRTVCNDCGEFISKSGDTIAHVTIYNFNDGYNTDDYDAEMDLCKKCLFKRISKKCIIEKGERRGY